MKYSIALMSAVAALVQGEAIFTNSEINPVPGEPFELTWSGATGPVDIVLRTGDPENLDTVETLASGLTTDSTTITLDPSQLPSGNYAFEIIDGETRNFSKLFPFEGEAEALPDASSSSAVTGRPTVTPTTTSDEDESSSPTASPTDDEESSTSSRTTPTSSADDAQDTTVPGSGATGVSASSPLALILSAVAAMIYFN